jgi:hypothetical protein
LLGLLNVFKVQYCQVGSVPGIDANGLFRSITSKVLLIDNHDAMDRGQLELL